MDQPLTLYSKDGQNPCLSKAGEGTGETAIGDQEEGERSTRGSHGYGQRPYARFFVYENDGNFA